MSSTDYGDYDYKYTKSTDSFTEPSTESTTIAGTTSSIVISTKNVSSPDVTPIYVVEHPEDEFVFRAMYAICGAVAFIILAIVACFVYRSRRIARNNVRRIRPRSRPGALSMELLERDLIESGLPRPAHQPLYGIESVENTDFSDISSAVVRENSHKRNTAALETHSEENGTTSPNVKQLVPESPDMNRNKTHETDKHKQYHMTNVNGAEQNEYTNEDFRKPPCSKSTEDLSKSDETNVKTVFSIERDNLTTTCSRSTETVEYENTRMNDNNTPTDDNNTSTDDNTYEFIAPDSKLEKCQDEQGGNKVALTKPSKLNLQEGNGDDTISPIPPSKLALTTTPKEGVRKKCPPPVAKKPSPLKSKQTIYCQKDMKTEDKGNLKDTTEKAPLATKVSTASSDYEHPDGITLPASTADENNDTDMYINATVSSGGDIDIVDRDSVFEVVSSKQEISAAFAFDVDMSAPPPPPCNRTSGYVNTPKRCSSKHSDDVQKTSPAYINIPKFSNSAKETEHTDSSADLTDNINGNEEKSLEKRKGNALASNNEVTCDDSEYANMHIPQDVLDQSPEPPSSCTPLYVNAQGALKNQSNSAAQITNAPSATASLDDEYVFMNDRSLCNSDNEYMCMGSSQEGEYLDMSCSSAGGSGGIDEKESEHGYVNTRENKTDGQYSVPRGNPYKTVLGKMKGAFTRNAASFHPLTGKAAKSVNERSKSTDDIYDYADLRSVKLNAYRDK